MSNRQGYRGGASRYQKQFGNHGRRPLLPDDEDEDARRRRITTKTDASELRQQRRRDGEELDQSFGFAPLAEGETRKGYVFNVLPTTTTTATTAMSSSSQTRPPSEIDASTTRTEQSAVDLYFVTETKDTFRCTVPYQPYFYAVLTPTTTAETELSAVSTLMRLYELYGLHTVEVVRRTDLDEPNHLAGPRRRAGGRKLLKLIFDNVQQLTEVRDRLRPLVTRNRSREESRDNNKHSFQPSRGGAAAAGSAAGARGSRDEALASIVDLREYDVPYTIRACIDLGIRCGSWYTATVHRSNALLDGNQDRRQGRRPRDEDGNVTMEDKNDPSSSTAPSEKRKVELLPHPNTTTVPVAVCLAFDIECTKAPLKFPDAEIDSIYMISYMVGSSTDTPKGFLVVNREIVRADVHDFEYTPKPDCPGPFHIFNERNEEDLIRRFLSHYQELNPRIVVTYNGDSFDWPFLEKRASMYGLSLYREIGIRKNNSGNSSGRGPVSQAEYRGRCCVHLDAFHWVRRDSYLPQGSQGLKAVTRHKLGYDPVEVDPEDMLTMAQEHPVHMATYSVSDAVATYYLYQNYVHHFIFSLCTVVPMGPEDVLRKGSGTLCETLLMEEAFMAGVICPNKDKPPALQYTDDGHLLESETYIGGKVECLETGVYRSDIEYDFDMVPTAFQTLANNVDRDLTFAIEVEGGLQKSDVVNYDEIKKDIMDKLMALQNRPKRTERPFIYHLDVGAMYPNIILTNRLQPSAIVDDSTCAACDFNQSKHNCKRPLQWVWRGEFNPSSRREVDMVIQQLRKEQMTANRSTSTSTSTTTSTDSKEDEKLTESMQALAIKERLKQYSKIAYNKTKVVREETRTDVVCMRENDFYVETVRKFRDRRYKYKKLAKTYGRKAKDKDSDIVSRKEASDAAVVYDSLQIAHKCILNSFYGYVMRKGARWRSMEMAGIVTATGAETITRARQLVEQIGRPLELDTDGIWCILPKSFPDVYWCATETTSTNDDGTTTTTQRNSKALRIDYPCTMLNADVHEHFTNNQYQTLADPETDTYHTRSECSIFFEVDGPYRCMVLPSSTEEGRLLKKRYAVFNHDGSLAELKGFEVKRRGELELVKTFQSQVFSKFLEGTTLTECYASVAEVADHWLDVLETRGESMDDTDELIDLVAENRSMSRRLEDYGDQKGTSQTTARRLGEFLGKDVLGDSGGGGLSCKFIIADRPHGAPVTERAVPTAIWKAEVSVKKHFLRRWLADPGMSDEDDTDDFDVRNVLDWGYYWDRLGKSIQKIITIPAALQNVENPVPRMPHPEWLQTSVAARNDSRRQRQISDMFQKAPPQSREQKTTNQKQPVLPDMEDMVVDNGNGGCGGAGGMSKAGRLGGRPVVHMFHKKIPNDSATSIAVVSTEEEKVHGDDPQQIPLDLPIPAPTALPSVNKVDIGDYRKWLERKKAVWRTKRSERRQSRRVQYNAPGGNDELQGPRKRQKRRQLMNGVEGYMRDAATALGEDNWHVLEIRETAIHGEFIVWVMLANDSSLRRIKLNVPRTVYVNALVDNAKHLSSEITVKKVDRRLPHNKERRHLYQVTLPERQYQQTHWWKNLFLHQDKGSDAGNNVDNVNNVIESVYEESTPLLFRALVELGCISKLTTMSPQNTGNSFSLDQLTRVEDRTDGDYLDDHMSYRKIYLYESLRMRGKNTIGIMGLFIMDGSTTTTTTKSMETNIPSVSSSEDDDSNNNVIKDHNSKTRTGKLLLNAKATIWIVKPKSKTTLQKSISSKTCEAMFRQMMDQVTSTAEADDSEFSDLSPETICSFGTLHHVDSEEEAFQGVDEALSDYHRKKYGPTFLLVNSTKACPLLRKAVNALNDFPVVAMPFPPGQSLSSLSNSALPLNWEPAAAQLCMEAYLYTGVVAFPRCIQCARFGNIPISNLSLDAQTTLFDVSFARLLQNSRSLLWASESTGQPDLGGNPWYRGSIATDRLLGDDDEDFGERKISNPGAYRNICVEIEIHDLAIAALTDPNFNFVPNDSNSNAAFAKNPFEMTAKANELASSSTTSSMAGCDDMANAFSFQILRFLVQSWLAQASTEQNAVANELLHGLYRLLSTKDTLLYDPSIHRLLRSLMQSTFFDLLSELQRLGARIISASFHRVVLATNKVDFGAAREYVDFVVNTLRKQSSTMRNVGGLGRIALRVRSFWKHYLYLDENNFGGIRFEERDAENEEERELGFVPEELEQEGTGGGSLIIPTVVGGWNVAEFLASDVDREYFGAIVGRFSKDVYRKEQQMRMLRDQDGGGDKKALIPVEEEILDHKRRLVSNQLSSNLTTVIDEILKEGGDGPISFPELPGCSSLETSMNPALEFAKHVLEILQLDEDVTHEVHMLRKSLLAQIGVQEYDERATWKNPCANFILPDVFCDVCNECRDIDLCVLHSFDEDQNCWLCEDCQSPYNKDEIEWRLVTIINQRSTRYQTQDMRCPKTNKVAVRLLSYDSDNSIPLKLDQSSEEMLSEVKTLKRVAEYYDMDYLLETTTSLIENFSV